MVKETGKERKRGGEKRELERWKEGEIDKGREIAKERERERER